MKYQYQNFVERRDLATLIESTLPVLKDEGINSEEFYTFISENVGKLDEFGGTWAGLKNAFGNWRAGAKAKSTQGDMDYIKNMDPAQRAAAGLDSPEIDQQLQKDLATHQASANRGFWGNFSQGRQDYQKNQADQAAQQRLAGMQQKFGVGPFGKQTPPAPPAPPGPGPGGPPPPPPPPPPPGPGPGGPPPPPPPPPPGPGPGGPPPQPGNPPPSGKGGGFNSAKMIASVQNAINALGKSRGSGAQKAMAELNMLLKQLQRRGGKPTP